MHMFAGRVNFYIDYSEVMPVYYSEILIVFSNNANCNWHLAAGKWLGNSGLLDHVWGLVKWKLFWWKCRIGYTSRERGRLWPHFGCPESRVKWFAFFTCLYILYLILLSMDDKRISVKKIVLCGKSDFLRRAYVTVSTWFVLVCNLLTTLSIRRCYCLPSYDRRAYHA
jgi:hypothetical protein